MSIKEKAIKRLLSKPKDYLWTELLPVMVGFDYIYKKYDGSRRKFKHKINEEFDIDLHEPHKNNPIKEYALKIIIEKLKQSGKI